MSPSRWRARISNPPSASVRRVEGVVSAADATGGLLILARQRDGLLPDILATLGDLDAHLVDLKVQDPGLSDCFLKLTGRPLHD